MATRVLARTAVSTVGLFLISAAVAGAYDRYSFNDNATNCRACHGNFRSDNYVSLVDGINWGNLHNIHRSTMLSGDCDVCHIGADEFPVMIAESNGGDGFEPISCMGCHGADPTPGGPPDNDLGAGLRLHHANAGVGICAGCHQNDPPPPPESTLPSYYFIPDSSHPNKPTDPCDSASENYAGAASGIDNDGDLLYDGDDTDWGGASEPAPKTVEAAGKGKKVAQTPAIPPTTEEAKISGLADLAASWDDVDD